MKKHLLLLAVSLALTVANGQTTQTNFIGVKGGLDWMTTSIQNYDSYTKIEMQYKKGIVGGFTYEHVSKNSIALSTGIIFNQRGY
jgi:hypothetical protein